MKNSLKWFLIFLLALSFFLFNMVEFEPLNKASNKYFQSAVFTLTLVLSAFWSKLRIKLFYVAFSILSLMIGAYLLQRIDWSNALASIGIGMLLITVLSYLPQIVKKGYVEKL